VPRPIAQHARSLHRSQMAPYGSERRTMRPQPVHATGKGATARRRGVGVGGAHGDARGRYRPRAAAAAAETREGRARAVCSPIKPHAERMRGAAKATKEPMACVVPTMMHSPATSVARGRLADFADSAPRTGSARVAARAAASAAQSAEGVLPCTTRARGEGGGSSPSDAEARSRRRGEPLESAGVADGTASRVFAHGSTRARQEC
jgi:hypothetical protein